MRLTFILGALLSSLFIFSSCTPKEETVQNLPEPIVKIVPAPEPVVAPAPVVAAAEVKPDIEKGRKLYFSNCLQCHNKDPNLKGSIGPEQADTPYEVMEAKIVTGRYPEVLPAGYTPKRKTKAMRAFPKLKEDVVHIYAWIQSVKK